MPTLLLGDLNTTPWSPALRRLLRRSGLRDSARGFGVQPTWPEEIGLLRIPIDHALHSPGITVLRRTIGPDVGSDHFPLCIDLALWPSLAQGGRGAPAPPDRAGLGSRP